MLFRPLRPLVANDDKPVVFGNSKRLESFVFFRTFNYMAQIFLTLFRKNIEQSKKFSCVIKTPEYFEYLKVSI